MSSFYSVVVVVVVVVVLLERNSSRGATILLLLLVSSSRAFYICVIYRVSRAEKKKNWDNKNTVRHQREGQSRGKKKNPTPYWEQREKRFFFDLPIRVSKLTHTQLYGALFFCLFLLEK